jgi:hypothetical protein
MDLIKNMTQTVLLVGCGNIGSRHLQSLMKLQDKVEIYVVEPQNKAVEIAKSRIKQINYLNKSPKIFWFKTISEINKKNDLVIIATNSKNRVNLISKLLELGNKRFLVEKMVCQSKTEYCKLLLKMKKNRAKGWVDTPRRYFQSYQKLQKILSSKNLILNVDIGNLGLGSNTIHFLDLFSWFSNSNHLELFGYLDKKILSNKRGNEFLEFSGIIFAKTKNGAILTVTSHSHQNTPLTLSFVNKDYKVLINETNSNLTIVKGTRKLDYKNNFVSDISSQIVMDILKHDSCLLPSLENSYFFHVELFKIFNQHLKKNTNQLCPIT